MPHLQLPLEPAHTIFERLVLLVGSQVPSARRRRPAQRSCAPGYRPSPGARTGSMSESPRADQISGSHQQAGAAGGQPSAPVARLQQPGQQQPTSIRRQILRKPGHHTPASPGHSCVPNSGCEQRIVAEVGPVAKPGQPAERKGVSAMLPAKLGGRS
ncbi:MAG: hypothetical protein U0Z44_03565 [Kouleothrix sp.]